MKLWNYTAWLWLSLKSKRERKSSVRSFIPSDVINILKNNHISKTLTLENYLTRLLYLVSYEIQEYSVVVWFFFFFLERHGWENVQTLSRILLTISTCLFCQMYLNLTRYNKRFVLTVKSLPYISPKINTLWISYNEGKWIKFNSNIFFYHFVVDMPKRFAFSSTSKKPMFTNKLKPHIYLCIVILCSISLSIYRTYLSFWPKNGHMCCR